MQSASHVDCLFLELFFPEPHLTCQALLTGIHNVLDVTDTSTFPGLVMAELMTSMLSKQLHVFQCLGIGYYVETTPPFDMVQQSGGFDGLLAAGVAGLSR